jgi:hypothetical protein
MTAGRRKAFALMVTLLMIMSITFAVGVSLTQYEKGRASLNETNFFLQSLFVIEDTIKLISNNSLLESIQDTSSLYNAIESATVIPIVLGNLQVMVSIKSAYGRFNVNALRSSKAFQDTFKQYLINFNVADPDFFIRLLQDCMGGYADVYRTEIFNELPWLFRDYVASEVHFHQIIDFYVRKRIDNSVNLIPWKELLRFGNDSTLTDINHISEEGWRFILPELTSEKIELLANGQGTYQIIEDLDLDEQELQAVKSIGITCFAPVLLVKIIMMKHQNKAEIEMVYEIDTKQVKVLKYDI